jgi:hypothetical protein
MKREIIELPSKYWFQLELHSVNKEGTDLHGCTIHFSPTLDGSNKSEGALKKIVAKISAQTGIRDIRSVDMDAGIIDIISDLSLDWEEVLKNILAILNKHLPSREGFQKIGPEIAYHHGELHDSLKTMRAAFLMALSLAKSGAISNTYQQ